MTVAVVVEVPDTDLAVVKLNAARAALAEVTTFDDLKAVRDQLATFQEWLQRRGASLNFQNQAAECRLRAERRMGAMLTETVVPRGNHGGVIGATKSLPDGITKKQSFRWRREAAVPKARFERWVVETCAADGELTTAGLLALWAELYDDDGDPIEGTDWIFPRERVIEAAFTHFRQTGFPYRHVPIHVAMQAINQLAATKPSKLLTSTAGCAVADSYHPERFHATANGHRSPVQAFQCDKHLRRALDYEFGAARSIPAGYFSGLTIVTGTQPCSNFRPGVALHYYRRYCKPGATVLDTSTGYGGRLVGFLASGLAGRYIGIDPNRETHQGNLRLAEDLGYADAVELHCMPVEDVHVEVVRDRCDFAFTSPPYFTKEHYSEEPTQSWVRYPTPDAWRDGFLRPMLRLQYEGLRPGAHSVVNVDDVRIGTVRHAVSEWTVALAREVGFELVDVEQLSLPASVWMRVHDLDPSEPIFIFRKPVLR